MTKDHHGSEVLRGLCEQSFAGAVREAQLIPSVERENCRIDLGHDGAEQSSRLHRAQPLRLERVA